VRGNGFERRTSGLGRHQSQLLFAAKFAEIPKSRLKIPAKIFNCPDVAFGA
jgi:hypothetical protein